MPAQYASRQVIILSLEFSPCYPRKVDPTVLGFSAYMRTCVDHCCRFQNFECPCEMHHTETLVQSTTGHILASAVICIASGYLRNEWMAAYSLSLFLIQLKWLHSLLVAIGLLRALCTVAMSF